MKFKNIAIVTLINLFMTLGAFASAPTNDNFADAETVSGMRISLTRTNVDATKQTGEPNHAFNVGGKSVWFKWTAPMSRLMNVTTIRTQTIHDPLLAVYSGTALNNLLLQGANSDIDNTNRLSSLVFEAEQGMTYYIAVDGTNVSGQVSEGSFTLDIKPSMTMQGADYDGDGMTDLSVFRPSTATWFHFKKWTLQTVYQHWGTTGDIPVVFTQSRTNDPAVYRPSNRTWFMSRASLGANPLIVQWGLSDDIPVPEMYGGGSGAQTAVFRPSNGTWYITYGQDNHIYYTFGQQNDIPVPGQYSADYFSDIAVFRPSNGTWYFTIRKTGSPATDSFRAVQFGQTGDKPVPADYDGDGILDIAVYRPSTGTWWVLQSSNGQATSFNWGIAEDIPTTGDFDGDGIFDYAVFRPSQSTWYVHRSSDNSLQVKQFGLSGDIPMTANKTF